jgi:C4-dicarboxylate-specific signal transduction histidine kinase
MTEFFSKLLASDFMPHGACFLWRTEIVWLHAISDGVIAISYYVIPLALVSFVRRRTDLRFHWMFLMFGLFIVGSGTTHLMEIWTLWHGTYRLPGVIKAITAVASVATAILVYQLLPQMLALPSPAQLRDANDDLRRAREEVEQCVQDRTAELAESNRELRAQIDSRRRSDDERLQAQLALSRAQEELAHMARVTMMGELAASIAHEVNQPLSAVSANAHACRRWLAQQPPDLTEVGDSIARILRDCQRAADIIGRIRSLMRKSPPHSSPQHLNEVVDEVVALLHDRLAGDRITPALDFAPLPAVLGDRVQLQQVILNLIMNGVEAMRDVFDRPRTLRIATRLLPSGEVSVTVSDSGVGVDPMVFQQLFDPFFTTKAEGMGMGLAVCRAIIQRHGGQLWASINDGPGATFHVALPASS